ncbi:MAG: ribosome maturation factor RimM [Frankiaceae bacterium]|nr:ribosome maturation factor RimM [Frankiaceae bacterium]MBV9369705.1 ribosome maturation factor RimM [Frankiales bacterium]
MRLVVGRVARAHGIGGEVSVDVRTDDPDSRFALGQALDTDPADRGPLTVEATRWHSGRLLVRFAQVPDRTGAEALRGTLLVADSSTSAAPGDDDDFWDHDLVGLRAETPDGVELGVVADVLHPPGPPLLAVRRTDGAELLVPFVRAIVPTVDVSAGRLVVTPPDGLLEL